jgi:hypothetical protein
MLGRRLVLLYSYLRQHTGQPMKHMHADDKLFACAINICRAQRVKVCIKSLRCPVSLGEVDHLYHK